MHASGIMGMVYCQNVGMSETEGWGRCTEFGALQRWGPDLTPDSKIIVN